MFSSVRNCHCLFKWLYHFVFPPAWMSAHCSTASPAFGVISVLDFSHTNRYAAQLIFLNLHFPDNIWCAAFPHMIICHQHISFSKMCQFYFNLEIHVCYWRMSYNSQAGNYRIQIMKTAVRTKRKGHSKITECGERKETNMSDTAGLTSI